MDKSSIVRAAMERGMSRRQFFAMLAGAAGMATMASMGLTGCDDGAAATAEPAVDYNEMSLEDIIAQAKEEGEVNSVGMPDTWANWVQTWDDLEAEYGIVQADQDMSSAEEIAMFKEEGTDGTKDIGDVGQQWGPTAEEEGVTLKYKTSYWDEIPIGPRMTTATGLWATTAPSPSSRATTRLCAGAYELRRHPRGRLQGDLWRYHRRCSGPARGARLRVRHGWQHRRYAARVRLPAAAR